MAKLAELGDEPLWECDPGHSGRYDNKPDPDPAIRGECIVDGTLPPEHAEIAPIVSMEGVGGAPSSHIPDDIRRGSKRNPYFSEFVSPAEAKRSWQRNPSRDMRPDSVIRAANGKKGPGKGERSKSKSRSRSTHGSKPP